MSEAVYNEAIIGAARDRRHARRLPTADRTVTCDNPLCGDRITLDLARAGERIAEVGYKVRGCLLTEAAAAVLAARIAGTATGEAATLLSQLRRYLAGDGPPPWPELALFEPVRAVRSRHECVLLPFEALAEAARLPADGETG
jgi:nitrogen fixation NifU-like protein